MTGKTGPQVMVNVSKEDKDFINRNGRDKAFVMGCIARLKEEQNASPDIPDIFFRTPKDKEIYSFLRRSGKQSYVKTSYLDFPDNSELFDKMTNPDHPLYLPFAESGLKSISFKRKELTDILAQINLDIEQEKQQLESLKSERYKVQNERNKLGSEVKELEVKFNELNNQVDLLTVDKETLEIGIKNIHGKENLEKIETFIKNVSELLTTIHKSSPEYWASKQRLIDRDILTKLENVLQETQEVNNFLKSNPVTPEYLEQLKSDLDREKERLEEEMDNTKKSIQAVEIKNIEKKLVKAQTAVDLGIQMVNKSNGHLLNERLITGIVEPLYSAQDDLTDIVQQSKNIKRRGLIHKEKLVRDVVSEISGPNMVVEQRKDNPDNRDKVVEILLEAISPYTHTRSSDVLAGAQITEIVNKVNTSVKLLQE